MNEFLEIVFLDNTVRQYLITLFIILFVFLAKRYIAHYIAGLLYRLIQLRWKTIEKASFKILLAKPLGLFLAVLVTVITLDKLTFPHSLDFTIYHTSFREIVDIAGRGAIIITFFMFLIKCTDFSGLLIKEQLGTNEHRTRSQLLLFLKDFIKVILWIVAGLMLLKYCFNYEIKSLVTGLSLVGAAIALALKENLENLIASFIIFFDKPFTTGDAVRVNNISGIVEKIGLRSTRIRSDEKTYITVPNKQMSDSILDNISERSQRRAVLKLEIAPSTKHTSVNQLILGLKDIVNKEEIQNSTVFVTDVTSTAIVVTVEFFTGPVHITLFNEVRQNVYMQAVGMLEKLHIEIAGKPTEVNITTQAPAPPPPTKIL